MSGCPLGHGKTAAAPSAPATAIKGECPMSAGAAKPKVYDVYSREIDPTNQMPANVVPSQLPLPGQAERVSTGRVQSSIPKGGTDSTWLYPSPQMFLNALARKNKADDVTEKDSEVIVAIHNNMNERTWDEVMRWENAFHDTCPRPALLRFRGRPDELSHGARIKSWLGCVVCCMCCVFGLCAVLSAVCRVLVAARSGPKPFDRHDWIVDRCGKEVRYVIDYYHDETKDVGLDVAPAPSASDKSVTSISVRVRPASDSFGNLWQRAKMALRPSAASPAPAQPAAPPVTPAVTFPNDVLSDEEFSFLSALDAAKVDELNSRVREKCSSHATAHAEASAGSLLACALPLLAS
jgi:cytochrome c heme-lyase